MAIMECFSNIPKDRWEGIFGKRKKNGNGSGTYAYRNGKLVKIGDVRQAIDLDLGEVPLHTDASGGFYDSSIGKYFKSRRDRKNHMKRNEMAFLGNLEKAPLTPQHPAGKNEVEESLARMREQL